MKFGNRVSLMLLVLLLTLIPSYGSPINHPVPAPFFAVHFAAHPTLFSQPIHKLRAEPLAASMGFHDWYCGFYANAMMSTSYASTPAAFEAERIGYFIDCMSWSYMQLIW